MADEWEGKDLWGESKEVNKEEELDAPDTSIEKESKTIDIKSKKPEVIKPAFFKRRWIKWSTGILVLLGLLGVGAWQTKAYEKVLNHYNAATVTLKVREDDKYALEAVTIKINTQNYTTDNTGKVVITGLVAGQYKMLVSKDGYVDTEAVLNLHRGDNDVQYISMAKLPDKVYSVKGFVKDYVSEKPLVDVQVTLGSKTVQTDPSGAYSFEKVAPGELKVVFSRSGFMDKEQKVTLVDADSVTEKILLVPTGQVVFVSNRDGKRSLYASSYDGSNSRQLITPGEGEDFASVLSPDSKWIAFSSTRDKMKGTHGGDLAKLYLANSEGKGLKKVSDDVTALFSLLWSPNSRFIYFTGYTDNKQNQNTYRIYDTTKSAIIDIGEASQGLVFSPDSSLVAYSVFGYEDRPVTTPTPANPTDPTLSPTTTRVAIYSVKTLNVVTGERRIVAKKEHFPTSFRFTSDSKNLSYEVVQNDGRKRYEIALVNDASEKEIPVLPVAKRQYIVSPDGNAKAFIEERDGKTDVYIVDKNEKNEKRLTTLGVISNQRNPVWDEDSGYLVFGIKREAETALYVVATSGGDPKKVTDYYLDSTEGYNY